MEDDSAPYHVLVSQYLAATKASSISKGDKHKRGLLPTLPQ
jgi:hypothetical protein